jgi:hypothetical protein
VLCQLADEQGDQMSLLKSWQQNVAEPIFVQTAFLLKLLLVCAKNGHNIVFWEKQHFLAENLAKNRRKLWSQHRPLMSHLYLIIFTAHDPLNSIAKSGAHIYMKQVGTHMYETGWHTHVWNRMEHICMKQDGTHMYETGWNTHVWNGLLPETVCSAAIIKRRVFNNPTQRGSY